MIQSMTGYGAAAKDAANTSVRVELRAVNGRFLKLSTRLPAVLAARERDVEGILRRRLERGHVQVQIALHRTDPERLVAINEDVVRAYQIQFERLGIPLGPLATLPGVLGGGQEEASGSEWQLVVAALEEALDALLALRQAEGAELHTILREQVATMWRERAAIEARGPAVVEEYQQKLAARLTKLVAEPQVDPQLLAREVAVLADRSDIAEELDRLGAHLRRIESLLDAGGSVGRTLEFLAQELLREANTVGSKSADATVAHHVVSLKTEIERFKEQIANVE